MTTLITGATGFVGKRLLRRLLERGERVRAVVRDPARLGELIEHPGLELVLADIEQTELLTEALSGVERMYHLAAVVKEWVNDWSVFDRVNVQAHERLLRAAAEAGVQRIVHTSSFMALGPSDRSDAADETQQHQPEHFHNAYERTKTQAMQISERLAAEGAPIVIVLPSVVFGPGELTEGNLVVNMLTKWSAGRMPAIPGQGDMPWSYAFVEDVVQGHLLAMLRGRCGQRYILGGEERTLDQLFAAASAMIARRPPLHLPFQPVLALSRGLAGLGRMLRFTPPLIPGTVGVLEHAWSYSPRKAIDELGYTITPFDQALHSTLEWMIAQGLARPRA